VTHLKKGIGIDVGGTKMAAVLGKEDGGVLDERIVATPKDRTTFMERIQEIVGDWMEAPGEPPCGIGIGLPGRVSGGEVHWVPSLPALNGFGLAEALRRSWDVPVRLQNDGKLALVGEQWLGAASGCRNVMLMSIGTGIGGGIMVDGRLLDGATGTAGSLGWMTLDMTDGGDSEHGWLERTVSGTAINRRAAALPSRHDSRSLFEAARSGSEDALELAWEIGTCIGTAIGSVASILDLELAVISGGLSRQFDVLLPSIELAAARCASPTARSVRIVPAMLLDKAGAFGALRLALANSLL